MADLNDPPRRPNGKFKAFFYDPDVPGHIIHHYDRQNGFMRTICVAHGEVAHVRDDS